jgi:predicted GNAT family N-acyltransferase
VNNIIPEIKQIKASETLDIRHKVMWPDKPIAYVELPNDENGRHFGLFVNGELTSIVSLFEENNEVQFRKFATLSEFQGLGHGTMLLERIIDVVKNDGIHKLWCNARVEKSNFYERFGFKLTDKTYEKGGIEFVIMEKTFVTFC